MIVSCLKNLLIFLLLLFLSTSCAKKIPLSEFEEFSPYIQQNEARLPVILVPGIKGSILERNGKVLWGRSYRVALFSKFDELQFHLDRQINANDTLASWDSNAFKDYYTNEITWTYRVMETYRIGMIKLTLYKASIYEDIIKSLEEVGYKKGTDLFTLPYDWRLDNRIAAVRLAMKVKEIQEAYKNTGKNVRVNIIAHSMGGLIARYYLNRLDGKRHTNKLIMLSTPHKGLMDSLRGIAEGEYPESIFHLYTKEKTRPIIFSWPSIFQLLPRYEDALRQQSDCDKTSPVGLVDYKEWGLSGKDMNFSDVVDQWDNYNLIPKEGHKFSEKYNVSKEHDLVTKYLEFQLNDAHNFYLAINDNPAADIEYEENKIKQIVGFLKADENEIHFTYPPADCRDHIPHYVMFGGHCRSTLKRALLTDRTGLNGEPEKGIIFENTSKECHSHSQGDGRVPVESYSFNAGKECSKFEFFMCEDHGGVVRNQTFQYNLIRELLREDGSQAGIH